MAEDSAQAREGFTQDELGWVDKNDPILTDAMTGAFNKTAYEKIGHKEFQHSIRTKTPLSMVFIDLDNFKELNDTKGHLEADNRLIDLKNNLNGNIRNSDYLFRWGGDEFIILANNSSAKAIKDHLEPRLREAVIKSGVRASFGIAEREAGDTLESVFDRAEQLMYKEKEGKKNV